MGQDSSRGCRPFHVYQWDISVLSSSLLLSLFKKAFLLRAYHPHRGSLNKQKSSLFSCNLTLTLKFLLDHDPMILVFRRDLVIMKVYIHARTPFTITSESNVGSSDNQIHNIYRPQTKFAKVMFLHVSVCPQGVPGQVPPWESTPRGQVHPPGQVHPRQVPPGQVHNPGSSACWEIWVTSGRYASYWNAFLFYRIISISVHSGTDLSSKYLESVCNSIMVNASFW